ncbi:lck-interacting transmembrane adapter 1 [Apteryx mantelli]|uniref:Lck-interacting transmembrane adapter 1 n=1 Tax=Apteryx mantelli TaxID=2696672 RepID=A0ABM4FGF2_9AVES
MAAAEGGEGLPGPPLLPAVAPLALLGALVYLGALCAACRRKGRKKKVPTDAVKLVDKALLRQTQLRSLSKSDTTLHELCRLQPKDEGQRPASLDLLHALGAPDAGGDLQPRGSSSSILPHRELPRIPGPRPPEAEQTYSNLLFAPPPRRPAAPPAAPAAAAASADYACVRKAKKPEPPDGAAVAEAPRAAVGLCQPLGSADPERDSAPGPSRGDGRGPPLTASPGQVEDMYSTVCKGAGRKARQAASPPRDAAEPGRHWPRCPRPDASAEPCYESIGDGAWPGPDPDYEAVDANWRKPGPRGRPRPPEHLYESVGEGRRGSARAAPNGLEVYVTNL